MTLSIMQIITTLSVSYNECHIQALYAECHYAECHYVECRYSKCHYAECRGALVLPYSLIQDTTGVFVDILDK
jgi:hypothetical protein